MSNRSGGTWETVAIVLIILKAVGYIPLSWTTVLLIAGAPILILLTIGAVATFVKAIGDSFK